MLNALNKIRSHSLFTVLLMAFFISVTGAPEMMGQDSDANQVDTSLVEHPEWSKDANIYEVNIRQYSEEGTFKAFEKDLPRLKEMGVEIVWLMPIHPIGDKNRKGRRGSYYSVKDYKGVNPHFGTLEDFKSLVQRVHELDMKIILDWVANHTAWDHPWTEQHPEWYTKDEEGNFKPPVEDWSDVIELDFDQQGLRDAMVDAMEYWVREANIDGYRCDVAMEVPTDFWNRVRRELDEIKPVFMLAEAEVPEHHYKAFDMSYGWEFHHIMNEIAAGNREPVAILQYMKREENKFPENAYRMYFTSNHDENSWNGTVFERMGDGARAFAVLSATMDGMPLIYNGQEEPMRKRLEFFERDPIEWGDYAWQDFYSKMLHLKKRNKALWNGQHGGDFKSIETGSEKVIAYKRTRGVDQVLVVLNLSEQKQQIPLDFGNYKYNEIFTSKAGRTGKQELKLQPWGYRVYENE